MDTFVKKYTLNVSANILSSFFFIGIRGVIGRAFLLPGLRTDFKRKLAYPAIG